MAETTPQDAAPLSESEIVAARRAKLKRFREELDGRFARHYHDLEQGTDAIAFVDPYADIESFHRRDAARVELVGLAAASTSGVGGGGKRNTNRSGWVTASTTMVEPSTWA